MNSIGIIGTGRLGLSFALLCAKKGYKVYGHDKRQDYIDSLNTRTYTTVEPFIEQYLRETTVEYTTKLSKVAQECDILFCFVATPSKEDGSYDHSAVEEVVVSLENIHAYWSLQGKTLVIGCTTMPGYTNSLKPRMDKMGIHIAYNPEFIAQGDILNGLKKADMILIGANEESTVHALTGIYRTIMDKEPVINSMSPTAAEITKISINCFLTMKIAYANMIGEICINSNIYNEISIVLRAIGSDSRIGNKYLGYGFGYGGPCLPRDMSALGTHALSVGLLPLLQSTIDGCNNNHAVYLKNYYIRQNNDNLPFIFTQLTYKKGIDMLTESQQWRLCKDLLEAGYSIDITEIPSVIEQVKPQLNKYGDKVTYGTAHEGILIDLL